MEPALQLVSWRKRTFISRYNNIAGSNPDMSLLIKQYCFI
jgi:hypothetical protein